MATDQWQQVQALFERAVQLEATERASFLEDVCGDDAELRCEVESLLNCDRLASENFMRPPQPDPSVPPFAEAEDAGALVGTEIGHYRIQRVIAAGGMGTVYEALQEQPQRTVALKVLHRNVASRLALRRFQFESQVLARLEHRNIAHVFEAGMHTSQRGAVPYFAMEYVRGATTITEYARDRQLSTHQLLLLFATVCDAVHHGHQKGVIHRDLKPANILVDESGEPKVIDFGVARSTDSDLTVATQHTSAGQLVGTMQYMSPEQCDADPHGLDMRSDVYSLGVVAYELLTGQSPYDASGSTIFRATRIIKEQIPKRLSEINRKLRGDVETIVLKTLEKDREKRYGSAADLARDIRRHLNREPIEARPPNGWNRAVRWATRHPLGTTAAGCLFMAAATVVATYAAVWFVNERPAHLVVLKRPGFEKHEQGYAAQLQTRNGNDLKTWPARTDLGIADARIVDRPNVLGSGRLALIGFTDRHGVEFPRSLCVFDVNDPDTILWRHHVETGEVLPDPHNRGYVAEHFSIRMFWLYDVFPKHPGDEIVAIHHHTIHSQCFIRIYGLDRDLLYQVWYDGAISQCLWLPEVGLLVFGGDSAEVFAERRGILGVSKPHPYVLFAIRPKAELVRSAYLETTPGIGPLFPVWLRLLKPANCGDLIDDWWIDAEEPNVGKRGKSFRVTLNAGGEPVAELWWEVDEHGDEIARSRGMSDAYERNLRLPVGHSQRHHDPDVFGLGDLPPVVSTPAESDSNDL